jgi:hypothetical protein
MGEVDVSGSLINALVPDTVCAEGCRFWGWMLGETGAKIIADNGDGMQYLWYLTRTLSFEEAYLLLVQAQENTSSGPTSHADSVTR